jgi:hypothetical protein
MDARMQSLESALAKLHDLRDLSEIISVQYNPFLAAEETSPEERHTAADLLMRRLGVRSEERVPEAAEALPLPEAEPMPVRLPAPVPEPEPIHEHDEAPAPPAPAPMPVAEPAPAEGRLFSVVRPVGGPRETFLAIHWFTYLAEGTDPSVIFCYLDHYRETGWFGPAEHHWLEGLARGLATRKQGATWADYGLDARRLAANHLRNLRVLDKIFGATLQHGEAQYLQQTLDALLGEP